MLLYSVIICGAIPLLAIPINLIICKYLINKEIQEVKSNAEINNGYECQICGALFEPNKANRYLVVENEAPIIAVFTLPTTYECFDCPKCGCQNRVNERKGGYIIDEQRKADTDEHL